MKKILFCVVLLFSFLIYGCSGGETDSSKEHTSEESGEKNGIKESVPDDNILTSLSLIDNTKFSKLIYKEFEWAERNKINLFKFTEIKNIADWYDKNVDYFMDKGVFVRYEEGFFSSNYKRTLNKTGYLYYGELKDSMPHGIGVLCKISEFPGEDGKYLYCIQYIGYFDEGQASGYGMEFNVPKIITSDSESLEYEYSLCYEGYFNDDVWEGQGNIFISNYSIALYSAYGSIIDISELKFYYVVGETADDTVNGQAIYYKSDGNYLYTGEINEGEYDGKGVLYFENTNKIRYEGEFSDGKFNGEGILYDENGEVVHKGKFDYGDID